MFLFELFDSSGEMMKQLRQAALDFITPMLGQSVPFVTVQQVIDALKNDDFGININRFMVMQILDPEQMKAVKKIEGDRVYLNNPESPDRETDAEEAQNERDDVQDMAQKQAKNQIQKK